VDRGVDAVGYQAKAAGNEVSNSVLMSLVKVVRATGGIGAPGFYVTEDPGAADEHAKLGILPFPMGLFFDKGLTMGTGQCNV
jgi:threonine dehydrogenase-like Zn-dependent dehydrogenase